LVAANLAATVLRFVLLREWVFRLPQRYSQWVGPGTVQSASPPPTTANSTARTG
jgi:hypothetical protein